MPPPNAIFRKDINLQVVVLSLKIWPTSLIHLLTTVASIENKQMSKWAQITGLGCALSFHINTFHIQMPQHY